MQNGELFQSNGIWYRYVVVTDDRGHKFQVTMQVSLHT